MRRDRVATSGAGPAHPTDRRSPGAYLRLTPPTHAARKPGRTCWYRDATMSDPVGLSERLRLRRWLAAVGLTAAAEDAARVDTPETNAMALLGAHAACEALLGLLSGVRRYKRGEEVAFPKLLASASSAVTIPTDLADNLDVIYRMRNDFVHASLTVDGAEAARAISNARRLMELVPASLGASWTLPDDAGLGTAVAQIIGVEAVGMWLRHAEQMRRQNRLQLAADGLARALDGALQRTLPKLLRDGWARSSSGSVLRRIAGATQDRVVELMDQRVDELDGRANVMSRRVEGLFEWVLPLALGTSPIAYQRLRAVIGVTLDVDVGGVPGPVSRPPGVSVGDDAMRQAISQTAEIIFRLWAMGSLRPWPNDDKIVQLAQSFLANPSGFAAGERPARREGVPPS
jgi:hypothetical protein